MLTLKIGGTELFDEEHQTFSTVDTTVVQLEHSLVSLSKWESIHTKPFLGESEKTPEETLDYIRAMILPPNSPDIADEFETDDFNKVIEYVTGKHSATTFQNMPAPPVGRKEVITSELIYFWMVSYQIPVEAENWNLDNLFALIQICNLKNSKPKKMSRNDIAQRNKALNDQRRAQFGTKG